MSDRYANTDTIVWVPTKSMTPPEDDIYLVTMVWPDTPGKYEVGILHYINGRWATIFSDAEVISWAMLPDPYVPE